ncbi:unnamed protein product [Caenorhabditis brenneri]
MTAEVIDCTRRNLDEAMNHTERRMLFRRSRSEPMTLTNENVMMTSRTDPEWNMTVDSISIQSSFADYQQKRRQRMKKQEAHKTSEISLSSGTSEFGGMKGHANFEDPLQFSDPQMPSTLSLSDSENSHSSNDITSSQAKEISYEEEMRHFLAKNSHLVTNVFADPFDSDERKSRTEMWVEAATENLVDEGETSENIEKEKSMEKNLEYELELQNMTTESLDEEEEGVEEILEMKNEELGGEEEENGVKLVEEVVDDVEEGKDNSSARNEDKIVPPIVHQSTSDSLVSSNITESSILNSTMKTHLKEATEAQSEINIKDVDRFWDYLYNKDVTDKSRIYPVDAPSTSASERSIGLTLSPVKLHFAGIQTDKIFEPSSEKSMDLHVEQDRELDEPLEITDQTVETRFFELESTKKLERFEDPGSRLILMRTTASQTPTPHEVVEFRNYEPMRARSQSQNGRMSFEKENMVREISFKLSESLYKDLKFLVVERDRAKQAIDILPAKSMKELSDECNYYQARYRVRIEQNKEKLDRRIEEIWKKLLKMPIESQEVIDFISVAHSDLLTCNARRNLPEMI